ncbi:hypothetical protein HRI_004020300 [Hibiscus trionum]|uniref:Reverse transcriptase domain-containing protein n=1 Tax=Hibiscus trionum TaxID=183268 RepID=A0A9W7IX90_HIBTR|nr:hypothetical protein HRI_004020300 [Hibiscus trionum]
MSRRLKNSLEELIGETQFPFYPGKQLLDCSLISNEAIDLIKRRGQPRVIFKADFSKAYDTIDWGFLMFMMEKMGFSRRWRDWILRCISSSQISVLINGSPSRSFSIRRGLRQGCPLSPMLFNLAAEALSALLKKAASLGFFNGVNFGNQGVSITHLQFADDLIVFCGASSKEICNIISTLRGFEIVSGLKLNLSKSDLIGINIEVSRTQAWADSIGCKRKELSCKYLGVPLGINKNSVVMWNPVIEKFESKFAGWKSKLLSLGGRIVLIKVVLTNLPVFYMFLFHMPTAVSSKLNKMVAKFLWDGLEKRKIHWLSWETLCKPK